MPEAEPAPEPAPPEPPKPRVGNLALRFITVTPLIPILLLAIWWDNPIGVWAIVFLCTGIGLREFYNMTQKSAPMVERAVGVVLGLGVSAALYWLEPEALPFVFAAVPIFSFLFYLFRYRDVEAMAPRATAMIAGTLYVGVLLTFIALMKKDLPTGGGWVLLTLTCTWFSDTCAYMAGRFLGPFWKTKLYPSVSPKKTVVGGIGGIVGSIGALVVAAYWYLPDLTWIDCLLIAVPANVLGQMGDLCESLLKRSVGVKDSGAILPGHGGMLDRIDALVFAAPYIYFYAKVVIPWMASG